MGPDAMILVFWMLSFKPTFLVSSPPHVEPKYLWFFIGIKSTGMTIALIHSNFGIEDSENEGISFSPFKSMSCLNSVHGTQESIDPG